MAIVTLPSFGADPVTVNSSNLNGKVDPLATDYNGNIQNVNIAAGAGIVYSKLSLTDGILNADINSAAAIGNAKLNLALIAQTIEMSAKAINFAKGTDIASATTTDIGAAVGNSVDVTGTTTITGLGTVQAGTLRFVRFTGALILTHNATSLILPAAANITTVAADSAIFLSLGSGNWRCENYYRKSGAALVATTAVGSIIQVVNVMDGAVATGTTTIPVDDTIPQNTEGDQYMSLAITPGATGNKLKITVVWNGYDSTNSGIAVALFQDTTANALAAVNRNSGGGAGPKSIVFVWYMTAGTVSATTFKVRAGGTAGTLTFNGSAGARIFGGVMASSITIEEVKV